MEQGSIKEIQAKVREQVSYMKNPMFTSEVQSNIDNIATAYLSDGLGDWDVYAEGYKIAGDIVVQYIIDNDRNQYSLVFPVVFLYRQYLELRLKELIFSSSHLLNQITPEIKGHKLILKWKMVRQNIELLWRNSPDNKNDLELIEARLREFDLIDPNSENFRYPESIDVKPSLTSLKGMEYINLRNLKDCVNAISMVLDSASTGIYESLRRKHEMKE
jgi:hypothetical protein